MYELALYRKQGMYVCLCLCMCVTQKKPYVFAVVMNSHTLTFAYSDMEFELELIIINSHISSILSTLNLSQIEYAHAVFEPGLGGKLGASFSLLVEVLLLTKSSRELFRLAPPFVLLLFAVPLFVLMRRFVSTGDELVYTSTKFDGKTPILPDNLPRHQPSSTSPKNSIISPTARLSSSLLFCV